MGRRIDESVERKIIELLNSGYSYRQAGDKVGVSEPTVARVKMRNMDKIRDTYHKGGVQARKILVNPIPKKVEVKPVEPEEDAVLVVGERTIVIAGYSDVTYRLSGKQLVLVKDSSSITIEIGKLPVFVKELLTIERKIPELGLGNTEVW